MPSALGPPEDPSSGGLNHPLGQRPPGSVLAGYSEFPGGKVEPGEHPRQTAIRECLEETGLQVTIRGTYPGCRHPYEHDLLQLHFFDCTPCDPDQSPRAPFRWIGREELAELSFPPANQDLLGLLIGPS